MPDLQICPIRLIPYAEDSQDPEEMVDYTQCVGEYCMLWVDGKERCALLDLIMTLDHIIQEMHQPGAGQEHE